MVRGEEEEEEAGSGKRMAGGGRGKMIRKTGAKQLKSGKPLKVGSENNAGRTKRKIRMNNR